MVKFSTVEEYLASFDGVTAKRLQEMRACIRTAAPDAEEVISYNMPAIRMGRILVYYAGYVKHTGLYALPSGNAAFQEELDQYETGKGSIRFPHDRPLPVELIRRIVEFRIREVNGE